MLHCSVDVGVGVDDCCGGWARIDGFNVNLVLIVATAIGGLKTAAFKVAMI